MPGLLEIPPSSYSSSRDESDNASSNLHIRSDSLAVTSPEHSEKSHHEQIEPIAVVGMGCRLPGDVSSASEFWDMMMNKRTGQNPKVPANRFNIDAHYHQNRDRPGSFPVLGGYFINDDLENFDPGLFNITPIEAMWMDPQQRKLLEVVYEALESGGIPLESIAGTRTGVYAASFTSDWQQMSFKEQSFRHTMSATGVDPGILSDRISYVFNLKGPSILCNTACSSSIYALHNACIALRHRECDGALVGGTNLIFTVDQQMNTAKIGVLSPDSTCHTFDESANGYGRAEGVGAVYLKRLADAERDGDPIRAVLRSSAVNHNGKASAASISYPGVDGQASVMTEAYRRGCDLDPLLTGYFECHGTGTAVGDPIEVEAISVAMNHKRRRGVDDPLMIGAVKTNIGHGEAASGLSALIKAILIVERGIIPPTVGIKKLSSKIKWDEWQVQVPVEPTPFPSHLPVRRVSVNTCGYGGTNAHVIVEGATSLLGYTPSYIYNDNISSSSPKLQRPRRTRHRKQPFLLPFSANDKVALRRNIEALSKVVANYSLLDLSHTLANRRSTLSTKAFTVASHKTLNNVFSDLETSFTFSGKPRAPPTVGFVFTGQGAQWPRMGAELIDYSKLFLSSVRNLDETLEELPDGPEWSIEDVLLESEETSPVHEAEFSQPLCTAVQIALVDLLADWGIRPAVTVGHSSGEMGAAYAAGLISAQEAIIAAYYRGQVTKDVRQGGAMMAVGLSAEVVEQYLSEFRDEVVIACYNSPALVTLSGDFDALETLHERFAAEKIFVRLVKTDGKAYHSHYMAPVAGKYEALLRAARARTQIELPEHPSGVKMVSSVTNTVLSGSAVVDETYWSANLRSPVLFDQAVSTILSAEEFVDVNLLIEIGPHSSLAGPIKQIKAALKAENLEYVPTQLRNTDSAAQLLRLSGELFLRSYPIKMERVTGAYVEDRGSISGGRRRSSSKGSVIVDLPRYQWNYSRQFWPESRASREHRRAKHPRHDVLGQLVIGASVAEPTWRNILRMRDLPWLKHHSLGGEAVFPAAGYFSMAIEAVTQILERGDKPVGIESYVLRDVSIKTALVTPDSDDGIEVLTNLRPSLFGPGWWDFSVSSVGTESITKEHMNGTVGINMSPRGSRNIRKPPSFPQRASGKAWNMALREVGFDYGPTFQDMDDIRFDGKRYEASCTTNIKQEVDKSLGESRYALHPAVVDSTLQLSIVAIYAGRTNAMDCGVVPVQVDEVTIWPPTEQQISTAKASAYAWVDRRGIRSFENSVQMTADDGELVMEIVNVRTISYEAAVPQKDETALKPAPYGEMVWDVDIDSIEVKDAAALGASGLANLALFKFPGMKVLEVLDGDRESVANSILEKNPQSFYTVASSPEGTHSDELKAFLKEYSNTKLNTIDLDQDLESQCFTALPYGILLASDKSIPSLRALIKPGGFVICTDKSTIEKIPKAEGASERGEKGIIQLVYRKIQSPIVSLVRDRFHSLGWTVSISSLQSIAADGISASHVVMLADMEGPLLVSITEMEFEAIQTITNSASSFLWVTDGGILKGKRPEHALASGLARSVRSEQISLDFRTLDIDSESVTVEHIVASIARVAELQSAKTEESPEREFCIANDKTYISRLVRNDSLNRMFSAPEHPEPATFKPGERIGGKILKGKVVFQQETGSSQATVRAGHVEVQLRWSGLTREGVLVITGADCPTTFSHEVGGVVTKVGSGVTDLRPGDRVVGINVDKFSSYQQIPVSMLHKLGPDEDMATAVSLLMAYANALYALDTLARLRASETVLILHGTGTSGIAAAKLAQARGASPYVQAATDDESVFLQEQLGLPPAQVIRAGSGDPSSAYDVVFSAGSAVDPSAAHEAWRGIAAFGRFVDAGRKDVLSRAAIDTAPARRGAMYMPFDMLELLEHRPAVVADLLPAIAGMLGEAHQGLGAVERVPLAGLDRAVVGFSETFGAARPVISYGASDETMQLLPAKRAALEFNPDATYLLVGCLGGLGRSLTSWMMESGARRFAFLSRSGADSKSAAALVRDIEAAGAFVQVVRGDVTDREDVVRAVKEVPSTHPIRGVVHAAMVLRDGLFHSMSYTNWTTAVGPKVQGAMNLHSVLASTPLDFFLMTSSVSGILGTPGQSNYAAANSYLDSLARHRVRAGLVATACVIPMVLGVGVVAENTDLEDSLKRKGMYGIDEEHLLQSFEAGIAANHLPNKADHVVIGLDPLVLQKAVADEAATDSFWLADERFSHAAHAMRSAGDGGAAAAGTGQSILADMKGAASPGEALAALTKHFVGKLARLLLLAEDEVEPLSGSIASYGIDSMIGAELRNAIFKDYRVDIPFQQLLAPTLTIDKFARQICMSAGIAL